MANIKISELNELTVKEYTDYIPIVDTSADETKKISVENLIPSNVNLIAVTDTAPVTYETGDKYFNTETGKIYTATSSGWANAEDPIENILYIVLEEQTTYVYDNYTESMISVGGGAGGSGGDTTPIGTIEAYSGSTAPNGYLLCDGSAVSRTTYSDLFNVIGTTYGAGDGSTTFNLPNLKGRVLVGQDTNDTDFDTLGETGGSKYLQEHSHDTMIHTGGTQGLVGFMGLDNGTNYTTLVGGSQYGIKNAGTGNSGNLQPYIVLNYIIKANKIAEVPTTAQVVNTHSDSTEDTYACDYINNKIMKSLPSNANIDALEETGTYSVFHATGTLPDGYSQYSDEFIVDVKKDDIGGRQILYCVNTKEVFTRRWDENSWELLWLPMTNGYSETETVIGTWIDGKPIYRKSFKVLVTSQTFEFNHGITNMDDLVEYNASIIQQGGYKYPIPYYSEVAGYTIEGGVSSTGCYFKLGNSINYNQYVIVVLEYTKTTD